MKESHRISNCSVSQIAMIAALKPLPEKHVCFASMASCYSAKPFCVFSRKLDISQFTPADPEKSILKQSKDSKESIDTPFEPEPQKTNNYSLFPQFFSSITLIFMVIFYQLRKWKSIFTMINSHFSHLFCYENCNMPHISAPNSNANNDQNSLIKHSLPAKSPPLILVETQNSI